MKTGFFTTLLFFATTAFADLELNAEKGRIEFLLSQTATCLAINCPPSQPYYQVIFVPENKSLPAKMYLGAHSKFGVIQKPEVIRMDQFEFRDQQIVLLTGRASDITGLVKQVEQMVVVNQVAVEESSLLSVRIIPEDGSSEMKRMVLSETGALSVQKQSGKKNLIAQIPPEDLVAIKMAIMKAQGHKMVRYGSDFKCTAEPHRMIITEGLNGDVQLGLGQFPCGEQFINVTPDGKKLIDYSQDLANRYLE